jgi:hypothetical protein
MRRHLNLIVAALVCSALLAVSISLAGGGIAVINAAGTAGFLDQQFPANPNNSSFAPTGEKPQSKLWFNGGRWWASMLHTDSKYYIFYLNGSAWVKTTTQLDDRIQTQADVLWDAASNHLFVASGAGGVPSGIDLDARLYRYTYNPSAAQPETAYTLDAGFPLTIRNGGAETIVLDKDTTGKLWITYTQGSKVYVNHSGANPAAIDPDLSWNPAAAYIVPAAGVNTSVATDDISSLVAFQGKIGVLWSNQSDKTFYFASHTDGAGDAASDWQGQIALRLPGQALADDHINLKSLQVSGGDIFAVVKTSIATNSTTDPRILVLRREASGAWSHSVFVHETEGTPQTHHTRPVLIVDAVNHNLYVFATLSDTSGIAIVYKTVAYPATGLNDFPAGLGTDFIRVAGAGGVNNPTSTKQMIDGLNGIDSIAVLASDDGTRRYTHNILPLNIVLPTSTPTMTPTSTPTSTPTATSTSTPTNVPTATSTSTPASTPTAIPTATPTAIPTSTPNQAPGPQIYLPLVVR